MLFCADVTRFYIESLPHFPIIWDYTGMFTYVFRVLYCSGGGVFYSLFVLDGSPIRFSQV